MFSIKKCIIFLMCFLKLLGSILGGLWDPFCIQKPAWREKCNFVKMSVSYTRELNFRGSGVPETLPKACENWSQNVIDSSIEKALEKGAKQGVQKTLETYKKASQNQLEKTSKKSEFSRPKKGCKNSRPDATKLRLRRRPPTKDDPQKEKQTKDQRTL